MTNHDLKLNSDLQPIDNSSSQPCTKPHVVRRLLCWLGFHKWINIDETPMPNPKNGEMICWSELHECGECKKQEYKGMGWLA